MTTVIVTGTEQDGARRALATQAAAGQAAARREAETEAGAVPGAGTRPSAHPPCDGYTVADGHPPFDGLAAVDGHPPFDGHPPCEGLAAVDGRLAVEVRSGWSVAPAGPGDRPALEALFTACSEESVRLRFFGRLRAFPREYVDAALAGVPDVHDAVVAYRGGDRTLLAGLASLVAGPSTGTERDPAELAVLVCDAWQRQGAGTAMITALLDRARERGVVHVRASVLPGRTGLLAALSRRLPPEPGRSSYTRDGLSVVYKLR